LKLLPVLLTALALLGSVQAQTHDDGRTVAVKPAVAYKAPSVEQWLMRLHASAHQSAYVGTFVVTTSHAMSSAKIWHVREGEQQIERVEALSGVPRSTYRRNDQVVTYLPQSRLAITEKRASLGLFPSLLSQADSSIARFYQLQPVGHDRVAGFVTDVVELKARDSLRFGYRIWTTQSTGLVVKLQTLDTFNGVLEQAAFSELQLAKPLSWGKLSAMMDDTEGYTVKTPELMPTSAEHEGWRLRKTVPGFRSMSCYKHLQAQPETRAGPLQWVFSDGLASVSLFIETFDAARHHRTLPQETFAVGATRMLTRRVGAWRLTVVGEVPVQTLEMFAAGLERKN